MEDQKKIETWSHDKSYVKENLFIKKLRRFFTENQIVKILDAIDTTCNECWDDEKGCQCWNDE